MKVTTTTTKNLVTIRILIAAMTVRKKKKKKIGLRPKINCKQVSRQMIFCMTAYILRCVIKL